MPCFDSCPECEECEKLKKLLEKIRLCVAVSSLPSELLREIDREISEVGGPWKDRDHDK